MTKQDVVNALALELTLSKKDAEKAMAIYNTAIINALKKGEKVSLPGFGTFEVRYRLARTGRNPATGAEISIPASKTPVFKPAKAFKDALN